MDFTLSNDGTLAARQKQDLLEVLNLTDGSVVRTLPLPPGKVDHLILAPGGRWVLAIEALAKEDQENLQLFDLSRDAPWQMLAASGQWPGNPPTTSFDASGNQFAIAGASGAVSIWDLPEGRRRALLSKGGPNDSAISLAMNEAGDQIVVGYFSGYALLWNVTTAIPVTSGMEHEAAIASVSISQDGRRILTGSLDQTSRLWDSKSGKAIGEPLRHQGPVFLARFRETNGDFLTLASDGQVRNWKGGTPLPPVSSHELEKGTRILEMSPLGSYLAVLKADGLYVVRRKNNETLFKSPEPFQNRNARLAFSRDETRLTLIGSRGRLIRIELPSGQFTETQWNQSETRNGPQRFSLSSRGTFAVALQSDREEAGEQTLRFWDLREEEPVHEDFPIENLPFRLVPSDDGQRLLVGTRDGMELWTRTPDGFAPRQFEGLPPDASFQFNESGNRALVGGDTGTFQLWDLDAFRPLTAPLNAEGALQFLRFNPTETHALACSVELEADGPMAYLRLWDLALQEPLTPAIPYRIPRSRQADGPGNRKRKEIAVFDGTRLIAATGSDRFSVVEICP
ncbi:MAG: WD40 repeat domain-containing protein, partial [Verrucomicrobiota bacterium]